MLLKKIKNYIFSIFRFIPITIKVTIWYSTFIIFLLAVIIVGSFVGINEFSDRFSKRDLIESVNKIASNQERFKNFDDGIYFSYYNNNGELLSGLTPNDINIDELSYNKVSEFKLGETQYYYYDSKVVNYGTSELGYIRGIVNISSTKKTLQIFPIILLVISPFLITIVIYGGYKIIKNSFKPIRIITQTARDIESSGDLVKRIELPNGKDEIHNLATVLNNMLTTLENSYNREKQFSSDVSHELRTPVSVILAESEYAIKYADTLEESKQSFEVIERQSKKMTTMINQILEISRIEQLEKLELEEVDLTQFISSIIKDYDKILEKNNIALKPNIEVGVFANINIQLFQRLFDNLFLNAIKFTTDEIIIKLKKYDNKVALIFEDNGDGIPKEEFKNIWLRFYKIDKSRTNTENDSSGLGLSISKKIVELHNGEISVENRRSGGARFIINI